MTKFELYLEKSGYVRHEYSITTGLFTATKKHLLSSMGTLAYFYIHPSDIKQEKNITIGLNESKKHPTLIYPRPNIGATKRETLINKFGDDMINKLLQLVDFKDILKVMFNKKLTFIENNGKFTINRIKE